MLTVEGLDPILEDEADALSTPNSPTSSSAPAEHDTRAESPSQDLELDQPEWDPPSRLASPQAVGWETSVGIGGIEDENNTEGDNAPQGMTLTVFVRWNTYETCIVDVPLTDVGR